MKKILKLINIFIATITLYACSEEQIVGNEIPVPATKGLMEVEVIQDNAKVEDYVHTARFIVFDNATSFPTVDINQLITLDQKDAQTFKLYLKVLCNPDKMLLVILNEPDELTGFLESVTSPSDLHNIKFQMADVFNNNHTAPKLKGIPMTGMAHNIVITESNASENEAFRQVVTVNRSVARVEMWFKTLQPIKAWITKNTKISLSNSHHEGYLMDPEIPGFGNIQKVDMPNQTVVWQHTGDDIMIEDEAHLHCVFYTPERTCSAENNADKLVLTIEGLSTSEGVRNATAILSEFMDNSSLYPVYQEIKEIKRNRVYKTIGNIHKERITFECISVPWYEIGENVIIDPQYYLKVSNDYFYLPYIYDFAQFTAETNYDRADRGFPIGLCLGETLYYTNTGQLVTDPDSNLYGWLHLALGNQKIFYKEIFLSLKYPLDNDRDKGCYATLEIKGGNLTKLIKVCR